MKFSVILMISENALSIHMEKPFNPILGETFQGWIDGCPIYMEQISHHPPISAYYFVGRGYKKYGCMEPKVSVGLNSGSGYSIYPHYVEFDDGMKIEYVCAKIVIGGLLIGERTFNFEDKSKTTPIQFMHTIGRIATSPLLSSDQSRMASFPRVMNLRIISSDKYTKSLQSLRGISMSRRGSSHTPRSSTSLGRC